MQIRFENIRCLFLQKTMLNNVLILAYWSKVYNSLTKIDTIRLCHLRSYPAMATDYVGTDVSACVESGIRAASWSFSWNTISNYITTHLINWKVVSLLRNCYPRHCDRCKRNKVRILSSVLSTFCQNMLLNRTVWSLKAWTGCSEKKNP